MLYEYISVIGTKPNILKLYSSKKYGGKAYPTPTTLVKPTL